MSDNTDLKPSEMLEGMTLDNGWKVVERYKRNKTGTGGLYSVGYIVKKDNKDYFLKAFCYSEAFQKGNDTPRMLQNITTAFNFERDILNLCQDNNLTKVVNIVDSGTIVIPSVPYGNVEYLIFELGDGDVRKIMDNGKLEMAWVLRSLHNITVGLRQIHSAGVAHQDIKPSNVVIFNNDVSKISDLGSSSISPTITNIKEPEHAEHHVSGSRSYAPPELLYRSIDPDWRVRRLGCDLYLLGSMVVFYFTSLNMTALLKKNLHSSIDWDNWSGTYPEVLPYVNEAFEKAIEEFSSQIQDQFLKEKLVEIVKMLCNPDPKKRGHKKSFSRIESNFSLERFVTAFDVLANKYEIGS